MGQSLRVRRLPKTGRYAAGATWMRCENGSRRPLGSIQVVARHLFDKRDDAAPQSWLLYPHERLREREPVGRGEEVENVGGRWRLSNCLGLAWQVRRAFEEERHRDLQYMRDVLQAARAHTVRSLLVFLHLLEREPESIAELFLTHSEHHPTHSDPAAYVFVDRIGGLFDQCLFHSFLRNTHTGRVGQIAP